MFAILINNVENVNKYSLRESLGSSIISQGQSPEISNFEDTKLTVFPTVGESGIKAEKTLQVMAMHQDSANRA